MPSDPQQRNGPPSVAELIVLPPAGMLPGALPDEVRGFVGRCLIHGIDFLSDERDRLPEALLPCHAGVKAVVLDRSQVEAQADAIARYRAAGVPVYVMAGDETPIEPNAVLRWSHEPTFHALVFDAGLTVNSPALRQRLDARDEAFLYDALHDRLLAHEDLRWYDATRYQWACLLDAYELTGDPRDLETVTQQITHAIDHVPNDLSNCDCVAPLLPVLRLHEHNGDPRLLEYARTMFECYLQVTPRWRGALVNFGVYARHVRSEILWQVLPGLMRLGRVTGEADYTEAALEQFQTLHGLLFDTEQGLWRHGVAGGRASASFWSRGAAFTFLANVLLLEMAPPSDPRTRLMRATLDASAQRLQQIQDASGFWHSVLGEPTSERESSGTAWLAAGFERALRGGLLDERHRPCADAAWSATKSRIWQGHFPGHMTATTVSPLASYYHKVHLSDRGWSHFAFRALCERRRARDTRPRVGEDASHAH